MKYNTLFIFTVALFITCCAESGEDGTSAIDCGEFGSEHDGHCHCADGYGFDGTTCVEFSKITAVCETEDSDAENEHDEEHSHEAACLCVNAASCPCDGPLELSGQQTYCLPNLSEEPH